MPTCDFFIVGAPKAATTAMYDYLKQHPGIFMPDMKEPCYFGRDLTGRRFVKSLEEYRDLFAGQPAKLCGEASTWYLYSVSAAQEIYEFNPDAKIIIMLRSPVDLMYSLHSQNLFNGGTEDIRDFEEALAAEPERRRGRRIPTSCDRIEALFYSEVVRFHDQVKRYFDRFGRERVHVVIYRDFKRNPRDELRKTIEFLGLDPDYTPNLSIVNENKRLRSVWVHRFLAQTPISVRHIGKVVPRSVRHRLRDLLQHVNTSNEPRPPLQSELRRRLQSQLRDEVIRISVLLERDLTFWCDLLDHDEAMPNFADRQAVANRMEPSECGAPRIALN